MEDLTPWLDDSPRPSGARGKAGAGASLLGRLEEVLRRLSDHEELMRRLLEEGVGAGLVAERAASAQASAAAEQQLIIERMDRKVERILQEVGRGGARWSGSQGGAVGPGHDAVTTALWAVAEPQHRSCNADHRFQAGTDDASAAFQAEPAAQPKVDHPNVSPEVASPRQVLRRARRKQGAVSLGRSQGTGSLQLEDRGPLGRVERSPAFDGLCALVITFNAVVLHVDVNLMMADILDNYELVGSQSEWSPPEWLYALQSSFTAFYILELSLRLYVQRLSFFRGADMHWNIMDALLVASAIFEEVSKLAMVNTGSHNLSFLRLLRLMKMLKMFRVFRLLRFFREIRMMLATLIGSMMALVWACLLLLLIQWALSLVFLQGISSYLLETPLDDIGSSTIENIDEYWNSVPEATLTLFKATSGGKDWAALSDPLREASSSSGYIYYLMFLLYIASFLILLMNVFTGMLVDSASRIRVRDNENMIDLLINDFRSTGTIGQFKEFVLGKMGERGVHGGNDFSWDVVRDHRNEAPVQGLLNSLQIDFKDAQNLFKVLQMETCDSCDYHEDLVDVDEFIYLCEANLKDNNIVLATLDYETKQLNKKVHRLVVQTKQLNKKLRARTRADLVPRLDSRFEEKDCTQPEQAAGVGGGEAPPWVPPLQLRVASVPKAEQEGSRPIEGVGESSGQRRAASRDGSGNDDTVRRGGGPSGGAAEEGGRISPRSCLSSPRCP